MGNTGATGATGAMGAIGAIGMVAMAVKASSLAFELALESKKKPVAFTQTVPSTPIMILNKSLLEPGTSAEDSRYNIKKKPKVMINESAIGAAFFIKSLVSMPYSILSEYYKVKKNPPHMNEEGLY